ncbi:MAG: hypothetical protein ACI93R_004044 [Flavobacteriales bacterium]|jgi:hypothetical protein
MFIKIRNMLVSFALMLTPLLSYSETPQLEFQKNPNVEKVAEAFSLDCVDWVLSQTKVKLDWSNESVQHIEGLLNSLSNMAAKNPPPEERIEDFSKMFGFYIGEVYRKNYGGVEWGDVIIDGNPHYGLGYIDSGEAFIWPIVKVNKRLVLGPEENVLHYYQTITEK